MREVKIIFGPYGDNGVTSLVYEVINSLPNKYEINVNIETNLLYDYLFPTIEINGRRVVFDYFNEEEAKEKLRRLIKGEIVEDSRAPKIILSRNNVLSDGVVAF